METIKKNHSVPNRLFLGILTFICAALQLTVFTPATANLKESVAGKTRVEDPFDHIKQVKAGVLDIGYVEAGPASGEVVLGSICNGTNPEQLFAAGWSACFIGAIQHNAALAKIKLPEGTAVDAEVDLGTGEEGFALQARWRVNLPGLSAEEAIGIEEAAHQTCPYSKASRNNINVEISVTV